MKTDRQAQQIIEYLLLFAAVIAVIFAAARGIGESTERVLRKGLEGLQQSPFTYNWVPTDCGPCSVSCGGGTQTCGVKCQRNDGTDVDDSFCEAPKPADVTNSCNIQPCPIDCVWGEWQEGTCQPLCGYNRVRIDTRDILTPAEFGGQPCIGPSSMTVACEDLPCAGSCGNGVIEDSEQCDSHNLNGLDCMSYQIESLAGRTFTGGTLDCYPPGATVECRYDMSLCEYLECDEWVDGLCGEGECLPSQRNRTRQCRTMTLAGTVLSADTESECQDDVACLMNCHPDRDINSIKCDGADSATAPDQAWTYVSVGNCPAPSSASCTAECPNNMIVSALGCTCPAPWEITIGPGGAMCSCVSPNIYQAGPPETCQIPNDPVDSPKRHCDIGGSWGWRANSCPSGYVQVSGSSVSCPAGSTIYYNQLAYLWDRFLALLFGNPLPDINDYAVGCYAKNTSSFCSSYGFNPADDCCWYVCEKNPLNPVVPLE